MTLERERILKIIFSAVEELNSQLNPERKLNKSPDTCLYGAGSQLDSLGLVTFIVVAEQKLENEFKITLTLADEKAMSQRNSPFRTIETLVDYITGLLQEKKVG